MSHSQQRRANEANRAALRAEAAGRHKEAKRLRRRATAQARSARKQSQVWA